MTIPQNSDPATAEQFDEQVTGGPGGEPETVEWVPVYTGHGTPLHLVEETLRSRGITVVRFPADDRGPHSIGALGTQEIQEYTLAVPPDQHAERLPEIQASVGEAEGAGTADASAMAEAEQDYDVRGCPVCRRFFHETYGACPGDGASLVPAVEVFEPDQLEPGQVVVGHGPAAETEATIGRLRELGFEVGEERPAGWEIVLVQVAWRQLMDRTLEVEAAVRGEA